MGISSPCPTHHPVPSPSPAPTAVQPWASRFPSLKLGYRLSSADNEHLSCQPRTNGWLDEKVLCKEGSMAQVQGALVVTVSSESLRPRPPSWPGRCQVLPS